MNNLLELLEGKGIKIKELKDLREVAIDMPTELEEDINDYFVTEIEDGPPALLVTTKYKIFMHLNHYSLYERNPNSYKKDYTDIYGGFKHYENSTNIYEVLGDIAMKEGCEPITSYFE